MGAAFGTSKAGIGIAGLGSFKPERIMKASIVVSMRLPVKALHKA
jgi:V-type H+-transporting ATPase proteolipid subunit